MQAKLEASRGLVEQLTGRIFSIAADLAQTKKVAEESKTGSSDLEARFVLAELHHAVVAQDFEQQLAALRQQNKQLDDLVASRTRQYELEHKRAEGVEALLAQTQADLNRLRVQHENVEAQLERKKEELAAEEEACWRLREQLARQEQITAALAVDLGTAVGGAGR